jgi:phage terminase large subunit-like protein
VYLPQQADCLAEYMHELTGFPYAKHDDQADSTSQALDWVKTRPTYPLDLSAGRWHDSLLGRIPRTLGEP